MGDKSELKGLPEAEAAESDNEIPAIRSAAVRTCNSCGNTNPRIASNSNGVTAYCSCGKFWPIASGGLSRTLPESIPRGLSKTTLVEPNWDIAFEDIGGGSNGEVGPKRRG